MSEQTVGFVLSAKQVAIICAMAKSQKERTRSEAWFASEAASKRLKQHAAGQLALADDVRLPLEVVVGQLQRLFFKAQGQWKAQRQLETEAVAEVAAAEAPELVQGMPLVGVVGPDGLIWRC
jgi:hypothetical protein